jgi:hypothetical protein
MESERNVIRSEILPYKESEISSCSRAPLRLSRTILVKTWVCLYHPIVFCITHGKGECLILVVLWSVEIEWNHYFDEKFIDAWQL